MDVVIIGNGVAGIEAARGVRAKDTSAKITIVSEESDHFFSRTALMWVAAGQLSHRCIEPYSRDFYEEHNFVRVRDRAVGVEEGRVRLRSGRALPFDRLLIACGSAPRGGPWPGSDLPGVGHFVTMQDLEWLEDELHGGPSRNGGPPRADHHLGEGDSPYSRRKSLRSERGGPPKNPCVIGGGLVGIEAVEVFHAAGLHARFFIREDWFWPMAIDQRESTWIAERMREGGVDMRLAEDVKTIEGAGKVTGVTTDKGEYEQDLVIVAIGVVPNTQWLEGSDIERDRRGGIVVDESQQTSMKGVYAAGDCASVRWFDGRQGPEQLWYTGRDQGRVAAESMLGGSATYVRGTWYNSAKLFDIEYTTAGLVGMKQPNEQDWFYEESGKVRSTTRIVLSRAEDDEPHVIGFNLLGRRWDHEILVRFIEEKRSLKYVLDHLAEASFDTEFVPPLRIPKAARTTSLGPVSAPAA
jgi:NADPH-dependent 2,4-dienoyl-CoA reductase/sulfur reductase-like enzyme